MRKLLFIFSIALSACSSVIVRPLYIIDNSVVYIDSFTIPDSYNQIAYKNIKSFSGSCDNAVQVCRQADAYLGNKDANWPDNMYATRLINDSIWEIRVDYVTRYTKKGTIYGGGALLYIRKADGEILYFSKSK